jgi:NAD(P)-dependent dehydrogenase (short-subunit alcohol dehydrogenase family)
MSLQLLSLAGRTALVTGAGTGLGRQMALGLAEAGANLVICGRRKAPLDDCATEAREYGVEVRVIQADVTSENDVQSLHSQAGRVDILVNNAGAGDLLKPWTEITMAEWRSVIALNLDAPFRLCQVFAPQMIDRRWGRIINISSIYGIVGGDPSRYPGLDWDVPAYFASKHGLNGITHYLAPRLAPYGVTINSIAPGMFATEQSRALLSQAVIDRLVDGTPMRRLGGSEDLKAAVVFLASPGSAFVTGQVIVVDGGWTVW